MSEQIAPGVWLTALASDTMPPFESTNCYLVASRGVGAIVDPGGSRHAARELNKAVEKADVRLVKCILLTHTHRDHIAGLGKVLELFDRPSVFAHPLEAAQLEGIVTTELSDGRRLTVGEQRITAFHTPGHSPGSLSFHLPDAKALLVGDLLAGRGSTWVGLPDGDVAAYLASLERLLKVDVDVIGPGHGPVILQPSERLDEARRHRLARERQVVDALASGQRRLDDLLDTIYPEVDEPLRSMARRSLLAHIKKLMQEMRVVHLGDDERGPYALRG